jgi:glycosyltransferase involved in cell wall biosynthesis
MRRALLVVENLSVPTDRRVWQESLALRDAGWHVSVICPQGENRDSEPFAVLDGVEIHRFPLVPASGSFASYLREYGQAVLRIARLAAKLARRGKFDVVHVCNPPDLLAPALAFLKLGGSAFVFDHHDLVPELLRTRYGNLRLPHRIAILQERLSFALADVSLATNESYRRIATTRGGKDPADVFVVRNAPDLVRFSRGEPKDALRGGRAYLLGYVGVMAPQDGADLALQALAVLKRSRSDWRAAFAGDGSSLDELRNLARELGLEDDVDFLGWCEDSQVLELLSSATVCLAPEARSPLNDLSTMIKVAEYMAMERPVVAFDLPETIFTANGAALYAPSGDVEGFAARIGELLDDEERRAEMGRIGRARVENELSWDVSKAALRAAYERALAKRGH